MPVEAGGKVLGDRYRVVRVLGSGGMATVFLCRDERLGRLVAVKRLHAHSPDETAARFVREAKLGASLNHPNLVSVYDTVMDDEGVLIVMELVEGETLADAIRRGPPPTRRTLAMIRDVASGLDHAHSHGVVHRDIKPANVLIREDGVTKLTDLGIATAADHTKITSSGIVLGTAAYMAPEQLEGGEAGPAVDVYALSVLAFEALSGRKARQGRTPLEIAHEVATEGPPDLQEVWSEAPAEAAQVLCRGMARDPLERPASAGELARELAQSLHDVGDTRATLERARTAAAAPVGDRPAPSTRGRVARPPPTDRPDVGLYAPSPERPRQRVGLAAILALAALVLAGAAAAVAVLTSGDDGNPAADRQATGNQGRAAAKKKQDAAPNEKKAKQEQPAQTEEQPTRTQGQSAEEQPAQEQPASGASGAQLNDQGFKLMQQGRFAQAVPMLQKAVNSFPEGTKDLNYAYALFNLGKSLNRSGRPSEAIPYLERRLQFPDQHATVQKELDDARRRARG
jgi:tetratricopeptide (TPR) repeat protein/predicted Ser/Thr protein kinase